MRLTKPDTNKIEIKEITKRKMTVPENHIMSGEKLHDLLSVISHDEPLRTRNS